MPLPSETRETILNYCDAHLQSDESVTQMFDFLDNPTLQKRVEDEFYAARYIYKLGEALNVADKRLHAHNKFQIVQYAGIYEAIIVYLLWEKFDGHQAIIDIENHSAFRRAGSFPSNLSLTNTDTGQEISLCVETRQKTPKVSIKFDDKIDAAVKIGFVDATLGGEIKEFYKLRNAIHLESAIKNDVKYELDNSSLAYRRLQPFTDGIRSFLKNGALLDGAKIKPSQ
jgi:hypothetical protein